MTAYNEYMKAYRAKNRDRINARQRERRKGSKVETVKQGAKIASANSTTKEDSTVSLTVIQSEESRKCCSCHLPGKHYARNRWFCDAHRP